MNRRVIFYYYYSMILNILNGYEYENNIKLYLLLVYIRFFLIKFYFLVKYSIFVKVIFLFLWNNEGLLIVFNIGVRIGGGCFYRLLIYLLNKIIVKWIYMFLKC